MKKKFLSVVLSANMALVPMPAKICSAAENSTTDSSLDTCYEQIKNKNAKIEELVNVIANQNEQIESYKRIPELLPQILKDCITANANKITNKITDEIQDDLIAFKAATDKLIAFKDEEIESKNKMIKALFVGLFFNALCSCGFASYVRLVLNK